MKDEILEQIDRLKMMVMLDDTPPHKTELEKYHEWVDEMTGRHKTCSRTLGIHSCICDPKQYAEYQTIRSLVENLYQQKYGDEREYHKKKPEIHRIIREVIAMTMYVEEKV